MRGRRRWDLRRAAAVAAGVAATSFGCAADPGTGADIAATAVAATCQLGHMADDAFVPLVEGGEAELTRGFQGYLLVQLALRIDGAAPRKTYVDLAAAREDQAPHLSSRPGLRWQPPPGEDGGASALSESFEVWLAPPLVTAFVGRVGWIEASVRADGTQLCVVRTGVRYVDREVCMHYDDGTLDCSRRKKR